VHLFACPFNQKRYGNTRAYTIIAGMLSLPARSGPATLKRSARPNTVQIRVLATLSDHGAFDLYTNIIVTKRRIACAPDNITPRVSPTLLNAIATIIIVTIKPMIQRSATDL